ncbi:response regulator transcription factor [Pseudomonas sp. NFR16]|uniref:response regulator transcription factor n=1 Tax=Pseudomonas sp. NFR16 TaxID=1566248 RepID=UPI0008C24F3B|nr:helix-turn-helix transcriptional regulator [Pseudomonas sp. NFR16]SEJ50286.1 regulatory protein, luxR family [Pseudomonas sp. NFR16]
MSTLITFGELQGTTGILAEQELRAAMAISTGLSGKQAAREMGCAPSTVKKTVERIFFKLGVSNRAALVAEAFRLGLIVFSTGMTPSPQQHHDQDSHDGVFLA